jgi:serine phosphatase RsbU (regulator of sigma subunit)
MGESLSLKEAAKFCGVSEVTMRGWVKDIEHERLPSGGYLIERDELMRYLAVKKSRKIEGASKKGKDKDEAKLSGEVEGQLIVQLRLENERLRKDLEEARKEARELALEIRKLEAEMRAILSSGGKGLMGAVSRWIKGN